MKPLAQNSLIQNRYLIVHLIGKGGMGEVYLAVDQRLGSAVAVKRTFYAGDETLGQAFEREAKTLARMRHPVLPKVSDHFSENEEQYLVMEHISGDDLAKRLELSQKPFPFNWVLFWADQLLDALAYLHAHEPPIIHRDIKPQNLKLTDENHIILLDFGLSKSSAAPPAGTNSDSSSAQGSVVGYTPHYAPMEQIRGVGTDPRSDIYSLSATLYQLLAARVPADALSRADAMLNGMEDPLIPLYELNPEVTRQVSDVIKTGMEISPDKRFADARSMQKALRRAFNEEQTAMSAETVAFNVAQANQSVAIDQPVAEALPEVPASVISESGAGEATVAFTADDPANPINANPIPTGTAELDQPVRQADVKTEVFIAGSNDFPIADYAQSNEFENPPYPGDVQDDPFTAADSSAEAEPAAVNFTETSDFSSLRAEGKLGEFSPDATVPFIGVDGGASEAQNGGGDGFYTTPNANIGNPSFDETVMMPDETGDVHRSEVPAAAAAAPVAAAPAAKKGSGGKVAAILGVLAVFLIVGAVAAGGGWYYYANYMTVEPTPSPTPYPTPTATPEATPETPIYSDSNSNSNSMDSNSNSNSNTDSNSTLPDSNSNISTPPAEPPSQPESRRSGSTTSRPSQRQTPPSQPNKGGTKPPSGDKKTPPGKPPLLQ